MPKITDIAVFKYNSYDRNPFVESDITWPQNYTTNKCYSNLDPDALPSGYDRPTFKDDYCSLVAATYKIRFLNLLMAPVRRY